MVKPKLTSSIDAVSRLLEGNAPPVAPEIFAGGTRVTGGYVNRPFDAYVPAMREHVLVGQFSGGGDSWAKIDGKLLRARPMRGTITFAPRGRDSERCTPATLEVSNVFLSHDRLMACVDQVGNGRDPDLIDRLYFKDAKLFAILDLLRQEVELKEAASGLFVEQMLDLVCTQLLRAHSAFSLPNAARRRGLAPWQVKRATDYMRDNLDKEIGLQELADLVGLSRFYFCGAFRAATGYTPHEWLTRLRIYEARRLLADPGTPIADIALMVGYQTPSAFAARFRRVIGITPREFRRRL
jgi:AraC family transcriptional regulator